MVVCLWLRSPPHHHTHTLQLTELVDTCRLLALGDTSVTGASPFPRAESVLDGLDAATAFLVASTTPPPPPILTAAVDMVKSLATARAGDTESGTAEWRSRFARLHAALCRVLAAPTTPRPAAASLSAAYADLVRAWLARFAPDAPPAGGDARLLRGVKRALRDRRQPLPLLAGDAAAVLHAAADALVHNENGGGARKKALHPFTDDTARALGAHAADDTALALADQVLAVAASGGVPLDRALRKRLFGYACRGLREALRDILGGERRR